MRKIMFIALCMLLAVAAGAQQQAVKQYNRYCMELVANEDGTWRVKSDAAIRNRFSVNTDEIPGWNEPFVYKPQLIQNEDYTRCDKRTVVFKTYPGYELRMIAHIPTGQGEGPFPYVMFIHGGSWRLGNERSMSRMASYFASNGVAAVTVSYTLLGNGTFEQAREDLRDAKVFIEKNAAEWKIDPARFGFSGNSAGGHLSAYMAMTTPGTKALIGICGPYDLSRHGSVKKDGPYMTYFGGDVDPENIVRNSPYSLVPDNPPACLLIQGGLDMTVSVDQCEAFAAKLREKNAKKVVVIIEPYASHSVMSLQRTATAEKDLIEMLKFAKENL